MHPHRIPWRSLLIICGDCAVIGFFSLYGLPFANNWFLLAVSVVLYGIAWWVGFEVCQPTLKTLEQSLGQLKSFLLFATFVGTGFAIGGAIASTLKQ